MRGGRTADMCPAARRLQMSSMILAIVGAILVVVGISLPFWYDDSFVHMGVFQTCLDTFKDCSSTDDFDSEYRGVDYIPLLWGLAIVGLIFLVVGLVFLFTYPCRKVVDHCKIALAIVASVAIVLAVICLLACLVIFVDWFVRYDVRYSQSIWDVWEDIGFAWYLTLAGVICLLACVICLGLHVFFMLYYSDRSNKIHVYTSPFK